MGSLTACLKKAGSALSAEHKAAILEAKAAHKAAGLTEQEAAARAIDDRLAAIEPELQDLMDGKPMKAPDQPAAVEQGPAPDQQAASPMTALAERIAQQRPDQPVILPGDDRPITISEALDRIKVEEADEAGWADLVNVAAQCALTGGSGI